MATNRNRCECEVVTRLGFVKRVSIVPRIFEVIFPLEEVTGSFLGYCGDHEVVRSDLDGRQYVLRGGPDLDNELGDEIYHNVTDVFDLTASKRPDCDLVRQG